MATLQEIRAQHPEYNDLSDQQLADGVYKKFYSDMPRDQFDAKLGFKAPAAPARPKGTFTPDGAVENVVTGAGEDLLRFPGAAGDIALGGLDSAATGLYGAAHPATPEARALQNSTPWGQAASMLGQFVPEKLGAKSLTPEQYAANPLGSETVRGMEADLGGFAQPTAAQDWGERFARTIGGFGSTAAATGGIKSIWDLGRTVLSAIGSQAATEAFPNSSVAPIVGSLAAHAPEMAVRTVGRALIPNTDAGRVAGMNTMEGQGIKVLPQNIAANELPKRSTQYYQKTSFFGSPKLKEQESSLNAAWGKIFGVPAAQADHLTRDVMQTARQNAGSTVGNSMAAFDVPVNASQELALKGLIPRGSHVDSRVVARAKGTIDDLLKDIKDNNGVLTGSKIHSGYTQHEGIASQLQRDPDPWMQNFGNKLKAHLQNLWEREAVAAGRQDVVDQFKKAKFQYAIIKQAQKAISKDDLGTISAARLAHIFGGKEDAASTVGGLPEKLAAAGKLLDIMPSSGSGENLAMRPSYWAQMPITEPLKRWGESDMLKNLMLNKFRNPIGPGVRLGQFGRAIRPGLAGVMTNGTYQPQEQQ